MQNPIKSEIAVILCVCASCLLLGWMMGFPLIGLCIGLAGYLAWTLYQVRLLDTWLQDPEKNEPPHLYGICASLLDRSLRVSRQHSREKQLLRANLNRQNRLISGVRDAVLLLEENNRVTWFNAQAGKLLNLESEENLGIPLGNLIRDPRFFPYLEKGDFSEPILIPAPGNLGVWMEASITNYKQGDKILVLRDVTRMERLEKMRSDFIANLSHELRTPLTVLRGYLETLLIQPNLNDSTQRIYKQMDQQSGRMAQLLTDLATLSKLESKDASRQPVPLDISQILERIVSDAHELSGFDDHRLVTEIEADLWLSAVDSELYSAFSNLVFNAVRHTPGGTKIKVQASRTKGGIKVEVKDNGPGIDAKHLPRITERFYRVDASRNSGTGGTGLGLAIVKHAMNSQGGQLDIESTAGKGASFICTFPESQLCDPSQHQESGQY